VAVFLAWGQSMLRVLLVLFMLLLAVPIHASNPFGQTNEFAQEYVCIEDKAVGFTYDNDAGGWVTKVFDEKIEYHVIKSEVDGFAYEVRKHGQEIGLVGCKSDFNMVGRLFCDGFYSFQMNKKNMRFVVTSTTGSFYYAEPFGSLNDSKAQDTFMSIGSCSSLDVQ
jgi:hypothetical protein